MNASITPGCQSKPLCLPLWIGESQFLEYKPLLTPHGRAKAEGTEDGQGQSVSFQENLMLWALTVLLTQQTAGKFYVAAQNRPGVT